MESTSRARTTSQQGRLALSWKLTAIIFAIGIPLGGATLGAALSVLIAPLLIREAQRKGEDPWGTLTAPLIALAAVSALSSIFGEAPRGGLLFSLGLLVLGGGSLLVGRRIARDPIFLRRAFLPALVVSTVAISVYVLYQSFGLDIRRTTGLTSYTNRMGTLLMFSGILGLGYLLSLKGRLRWLAMPYGVLVAVAMLTTLSRAAWVGGLVGAVILAFRRPRQGLVLLLVALLAGGALLGTQPAWQARFLSIFNVQRNMDRLEMWDASVRIFADHPILGIGPTSFPSIAPEYIERQDWRLHATPHNFVLTVAAEMGLAGLLALVWLGARVSRALAVLWRQRDPLRWGLGAALLALVVNDLFGQGFFTSQVGAVLWLTLGLVDGHQQGPAGEASDSTLQPAAAT